jgi:folate-dependent tRNA-U54 methylase TrmFO/GidA
MKQSLRPMSCHSDAGLLDERLAALGCAGMRLSNRAAISGPRALANDRQDLCPHMVLVAVEVDREEPVDPRRDDEQILVR